jgi:hypothetical protein
VCEGIVTDYEGEDELQVFFSEFFDNSVSSYGGSDDNNEHYTNTSCDVDASYGNGNQSYFNCTYNVQYYANSGSWNCTLSVNDGLEAQGIGSNVTTINTLLAVDVFSLVDFGDINATGLSSEKVINVSNGGNVPINLSLSGYAVDIGDGFAMNCSLGANISIEHAKYNLTSSSSGVSSLGEAEERYVNLSSDVVLNRFDLNYRQNDSSNEATNETYWRIFVPVGIAGSCSGNIVFGASQGAGI